MQNLVCFTYHKHNINHTETLSSPRLVSFHIHIEDVIALYFILYNQHSKVNMLYICKALREGNYLKPLFDWFIFSMEEENMEF